MTHTSPTRALPAKKPAKYQPGQPVQQSPHEQLDRAIMNRLGEDEVRRVCALSQNELAAEHQVLTPLWFDWQCA